MTDKHPCIGYEIDLLNLNKPHNSCVGCVYLTACDGGWGISGWECNRSEHELPYKPEIEEWVPYPYIPIPKENEE